MIISNARLQNGIFDVKIENGKIAAIGKFGNGDIDAKACRLIPGLIDVHLHGFQGSDFADCEFSKISDALAREGTTSYVATLMTDSVENLEKVTKNACPMGEANFLGFHLEGPYLSLKKSGAQNKEFIKNPDLEEFSRFENVAMITLAPEIEGAIEFIKGVGNTVVCIGHTDCDYNCAIEAIESGAKCLTHTFNVMPPMFHRDPGPIGAAVEKGIYAQLICDGMHVHKSVCLAAYRMFTSNRLILISDMIRPAGMPDGVYDSGGYDVYVRNGRATLKEGNLAGGYMSLIHIVKAAVSFGIDFYEAVKMASETPAKMLGINKGVIKEGYDADLVLLDDEMKVLMTIIGGKIVYIK